MRALTMDELEFVGGGSIQGEWGGSGGIRYRILGSGSGVPSEVDYYVVRADKQVHGMFEDNSFIESQCQSAFEFLGSSIGGIVGGLVGGAAAGVEVTVGVVAAPVTGGISLAVSVTGLTTAGAQIGVGALLGGFAGNQAGSAAGYFAC